MRKRFGLVELGNSSHTRIIMVVAGNLTGLVFDTVSEVIRIHGSEIHPLPSMGSSSRVDAEYISGVFNHAVRLWIIMDVERMFSDSERELLAA